MKLGKTALMSVVCAAALAAPRKAALRPLLRERFEGRARGKLAMALFLPLISILPLLLPFTAQAAIHLGSPNTVSLSQGLVGYWPLDGPVTNWNTNTTADISGNGNTGQLISMSTSTSPAIGKIGQALTLNGTSQYITRDGNLNSLSFGAPLTLSAWIKVPALVKGAIVIAGNSTTHTGWGLYLQDTFGHLSFLNPGVTAINSTKTVSANVWTHVAVTVPSGSTNPTFYFNGVPDTVTDVNAITAPAVSDQVMIGSWFTGGADFFKGSMDDVRIYDRALSAGEVQQLYHQGTANAAHSNIGISNGLVGYWTFDGPSIDWRKNQVADLSGQGNTGQLVSMATSSSPVAGKIGQALRFSGASYSAAHTPVGAWNFNPSGSVSVWLKPGTANLGALTFMKGGSEGWSLKTSQFAGPPHFGLRWIYQGASGPEDSCLSGSTDIKANQWSHVMVVKDTAAGYWLGYINGVQACKTAIASVAISSSDWICFGARCISGGSPPNSLWAGTLDDIRYYDRALSAQEVQQLYHQGTANAAHSNIGISNGLVGYWTFDGPSIDWRKNQVADLSGNGNTGSLVGMSTSSSGVAGKIGQALKGSNDSYTAIANSSSINLGTTETIAFWIKGLATDAFGSFLRKSDFSTGWDVQNNTANNNQDIYVRMDTSGGSNQYQACGSGGGGTAAPKVLDGNWHHVVIMFNNGTCVAYKDGSRSSSGTYVAGTGFANASADLLLVNPPIAQSVSYDDVRIYNRALSAQEVQQLYNAGR